jgi:predicted O-methyltransferase YrrM
MRIVIPPLNRLSPTRTIRQRGKKIWRSTAYVRQLAIGPLFPVPGTPEDLYKFADRNLGISQLPDEVLAFHAFLRTMSPRVALEIGTYSGGHVCMLSRTLPTLTALIGVDLHVRHKALIRRLAPAGLNVQLLDGDSHSLPTRQEIEHALDGRRMDVLFIDGDHSYEGVRTDYETYGDLVRDGGVIAFHDIVEDYEHRFGRKHMGNVAGEVPRFWKELKSHGQAQEFVSDPEQDGYGIGVLIK